MQKRLIFVTLAVIGVHVHYYMSFLLLMLFAYLVFKHKQLVKSYLIDMILPVLSLLPYMNSLSDQVGAHTVHGSGSVLYDFAFLWYDLLRKALITFPDLFQNNTHSLMLIAGLFMVILILASGGRKFLLNRLQNEGGVVMWVLGGLVMIFTAVLLTIGTAGVTLRHMLLMLAPLIMCFSYLLASIQVKTEKTLIISTLFLFYGLNLYARFPDFGRDVNMKTVVNIIENHGSQERVFFYAGEYALLYEDLSGKEAYAVPGTMDIKGVYDHASWFIRDAAQVEGFFEFFQGDSTFWLVDNRGDAFYKEFMENRFQVPVNYEVLEAYIQEEFDVVELEIVNEQFRIRQLRRK